jgi:hypothetical protein
MPRSQFKRFFWIAFIASTPLDIKTKLKAKAANPNALA